MGLSGTIVFYKNVNCAILLDSVSDIPFYSKTNNIVLYSNSLTNDIVFNAIKYGVLGIITRESSFATHGANILRSYFSKNPHRISWITGIDYDDIKPIIKKTICINNGTIYSDYEDLQDRAIFSKYRYVPQASKSVAQYNTHNNSINICYWYHRHYDPFTFSIMSKGLEKDFKDTFHADVHTFQDTQGKIWFQNGIPSSQILKTARNLSYGLHFMQRQIQLYSNITVYLSGRDLSIRELIELLIDYFSTFILFHNTYEFVFQDAYNMILKLLSESYAISFMDMLLFCDVDDFMCNLGYPLEKHKDLFATELITPIPAFSIREDISRKRISIENWFYDKGIASIYNEHKDKIDYWVKLFVIKEWKFLCNKMLFTRFSNKIHSQFESKIDNIKMIPYDIFLSDIS